MARLVIKHRAALGLSQQELAERVGTSHSAISRIESGRHKTSVETLQRVAEALGLRIVLGFESAPTDRPVRELVGAYPGLLSSPVPQRGGGVRGLHR